MDESLREFIAETNEHLAILDRDLVALEQTPEDGRLVGDTFRRVHSIKGGCGFLGLRRLENLLHAAENLLGSIRDCALPPTPAAVGTLLGACDRAKLILLGLARDRQEPDGTDGDVIARLELAMRASQGPSLTEALIAVQSAAPAPALGMDSIRVNLDTIDRLMAEVSELVLARNQVTQLLRGRTDAEALLALQRLSHVTSDLQRSVMKTRMQPVGEAWGKLPRIVRDLGRDLGKKIELALEGSETELDRQVLEQVKDPFVHLVRNAADHGIEMPIERRRAGKPETGTVTLSARQEGGAIVITLSDDGAGIDPERVRAAALRSGVADSAALDAMSDHALLQLIFRPGFTTARTVTSVSGRGVGLDVVRSNVEQLGGAVEIDSVAGHGTRFTLRIPLTLAIMPALLLSCAGQTFAVSQTAVAELVRVNADHPIEWIYNVPVLQLRGSLLPLIALGKVLGIGERPVIEDETTIAIVGYGTQRFGVIVDGVEAAEEIVVKPLSPLLRGLKLFAGSAVRSDGGIVLILDAAGLAAAASISQTADRPQRVAPPLAALPSPAAMMLVFRAGPGRQKAVPLAQIARIEELVAAIEPGHAEAVMRYRGVPLALHRFGAPVGSGTFVPGAVPRVLIAAQDGRVVGLVADEIVDTIIEMPPLDRSVATPGVLGVAVIADVPTDIIDIAYLIKQSGVIARDRSAA